MVRSEFARIMLKGDPLPWDCAVDQGNGYTELYRHRESAPAPLAGYGPGMEVQLPRTADVTITSPPSADFVNVTITKAPLL